MLRQRFQRVKSGVNLETIQSVVLHTKKILFDFLSRIIIDSLTHEESWSLVS